MSDRDAVTDGRPGILKVKTVVRFHRSGGCQCRSRFIRSPRRCAAPSAPSAPTSNAAAGAGRLRNFDKTLLRDAGLSQPAIDDLRRVFF